MRWAVRLGQHVVEPRREAAGTAEPAGYVAERIQFQQGRD
jgi:hypothetical protein